MTRPGVLFVGNFLSTTSNPHYCEELADRLAARGWPVLRTSTYVQRARRLADMLQTVWTRRHDYQVAHVDVFSGSAFMWAEIVCLELARLGKPYMLTLRGGLLDTFGRQWPRRMRRLLKSAALVSAPSEYLRHGCEHLLPNIQTIPNGIDADAYEFAPRTSARPRLIWVRAFHKTYNPVLAVDTLAAVHRRYPRATLHMIGADKHDGTMDAVLQRAREVGVFDRLALLGRVPKAGLPGYLADADIFINTTDVDNTPVSVLEAMAAGLCVVSTSVGGIPYLLSHERNALLVPPRDVSAMAGAIEHLIERPELAEKLSRAGHHKALECDWGSVLDRWEQSLDRVASHG